jgi:O-antigen/teichoic acid export membrane protein
LTRALENNRANARRLLRFSSGGALALGLPLAVGTVMVAPGLMRLLFGESGAPSVRPLQLLIFLAAISYWGQSFTNASLVLDGARIYMRLSCLGAVVNIAANLLVIPRYGYLGACWTTLGTELLVNFLFYLQVRRHLGALGRSGLLARIMAALAGMVFLLWLVSSWPVLLQAAVGALSYVVIFWISGGIRLLGRLRMAE